MSRAPAPSHVTMPPEVDAAFREVTHVFGLNYDDMCITAQSLCPAVTAEQDVRD